MNCKKCQKKFPEQDCIECKGLIDGAYLAKKPVNEFHVELRSVENRELKYDGIVKLLSPIGIALLSNVPPGDYQIKLQEDLEIKVSLIKAKGKSPYQGFDILSVIRNDGEYTRLNSEEFEILCRSADTIIDELTDGLPDTSKNLIREKLKEDVEKSKILDLFKVGTVMKYQGGSIRLLSTDDRKISLSKEYLQNFMERALKERNYVRDKVIDKEGKKVYDLHALPTDYNTGGLISIDVTDIIETERKNKERELEIYRDIIEAVTGGKLILLNEDEIKIFLEDGKKIIERDITVSSDLQKLRNGLKIILKKYNLSPKEEMHLLLSISEAATNALKHAGGGNVTIKLSGNILQMIVEDHGSGIDFKKLPKATLTKSYSDSGTFSLGNGFTLMFRFIDRLYLKTNSSGTTIILNKEIS